MDAVLTGLALRQGSPNFFDYRPVLLTSFASTSPHLKCLNTHRKISYTSIEMSCYFARRPHLTPCLSWIPVIPRQSLRCPSELPLATSALRRPSSHEPSIFSNRPTRLQFEKNLTQHISRYGYSRSLFHPILSFQLGSVQFVIATFCCSR